jgi:hypothetical protein
LERTGWISAGQPLQDLRFVGQHRYPPDAKGTNLRTGISLGSTLTYFPCSGSRPDSPASFLHRAGLTSLSQKEASSRGNNVGAPRIAVSKIRRLAALHVLDRILSISSLAKIVRVAKTTVVNYRHLIRASGYSFSDFAAPEDRVLLNPESNRPLTRPRWDELSPWGEGRKFSMRTRTASETPLPLICSHEVPRPTT